VTQRERASLGRILEDLGHTLLELVSGNAERTDEIGGVLIYDPVDEQTFPEHALVLGVGVVDADQLISLLAEIRNRDAVAVIVRAPVTLTDSERSTVGLSGVAVLALTRGATWTQLAALLRSLLAEGDIGVAEPESLGGLPSGDLFAVANAVGALLNAPVTIEDRSSRVLAFSGRQDEADASRVETIIGRQVPERYARMLAERGVFRELYRSEQPVVVNPEEVDYEGLTTQRVAIAVRAGDEILGSVWAAVDGKLTEQWISVLRDSAKLVALHLLRVRAGADSQRRLSADLVSTALEGGAGARGALGRLGLGGRRLVVLGASLIDADQLGGTLRADQSLVAERQRFADAFAVQLSAINPGAAVALLGDTVYGLFPTSGAGAEGEARAARIAQDFLDRVGTRMPAVIAIGPAAADIAGIALSRAAVDRVLRVLRDGQVTLRVARLEDVQTESLLLELRDLVAARADRPVGPLARLIEYDERNSSHLVETLEAWLDCFGDVSAASTLLFVHPNTFRYRLRRLAEISGLDLSNPEERFSVMLLLRILAPR
jgi:hypothetical protein